MFETDKPMPNKDNSPLQNPANWNKPKTWVVPLRITIMVDDPSQYDFEMKKLIDRIMNELRAISKNFDRSGKQLSVEAGDPIKDPNKWDVLSNSEASSQSLEDQIKKTLEQMKKKEEEKTE